ncbi:hypothetical protein LJK87_21360 [Paenibacillus sp. P25]|nr:hypothetical protein LJK87_21360 [Paenibacillus sp. P25]
MLSRVGKLHGVAYLQGAEIGDFFSRMGLVLQPRQLLGGNGAPGKGGDGEDAGRPRHRLHKGTPVEPTLAFFSDIVRIVIFLKRNTVVLAVLLLHGRYP